MKAETQFEKFKQTAKELETDQDEEAFKRRLKRVAGGAAHKSDCAIHNAPAYEAGACDCGATRGRR